MGGAERVISQLANQFIKTNHEVNLILLGNLPDFYKINSNVKIYRLGFENKNPIQKITTEIKIFFKLRKLLISTQPDAVLSFMTKYNVLTIMASLFTGINIYVSERNNPLKKISIQLSLSRKLFYRNAKGIIAQTMFAKKVFEDTLNCKNIEVIENPVINIENSLIKKREKTIITTGRLIPSKNHISLVRIFSKLKRKDWKLKILGDGPEMKNLKTEINNLNLNDSIELLGKTNNVTEYLNHSSIFAFTSKSEGYPNALVEGMCSGLACISYDCPAGPDEIINNGVNGFIIKNFNEDDYLKQLQELINSEKLRNHISLNALKIKERNNIKYISEKYIEFFQR